MAAKRKYFADTEAVVKRLIDERYTRDAIVKRTGIPKVTLDRMARANGWHFNGVSRQNCEVPTTRDFSDLWSTLLYRMPRPAALGVTNG